MGTNKIRLELEKRLEKESKKNIKLIQPNAIDSLNMKVDFLSKKIDKLSSIKTKKKIEIERVDSKYDKGIFVREKRNGIGCQVHFDKGKVKAWLETGADITLNIPTIIKQFEKINDKGIVLGELEWFENGKFQSKADTSEIINRMNDRRESDVKLTIYDQVYSNKIEDMHRESYAARREEYLKIPGSENIAILDEKLCNSEGQLKSTINCDFSNSKRISLRPANLSYDLDKSEQIAIDFNTNQNTKAMYISKKVSFRKEISFKIEDFGKAEKTVLAKDINFPYKFKAVVFREGTWHNRFYSWNVIKESAPRIMDSEAVTLHVGGNDSVLTGVGKVVDFETDDENKRIIAEIELIDTAAGKDVALLHANKRLRDVSVRLDTDDNPKECQLIKSWGHVAFVREGEVTGAKICYDGTCQ